MDLSPTPPISGVHFTTVLHSVRLYDSVKKIMTETRLCIIIMNIIIIIQETKSDRVFECR